MPKIGFAEHRCVSISNGGGSGCGSTALARIILSARWMGAINAGPEWYHSSMDLIESVGSGPGLLCCDEARAYVLRVGGGVDRQLERALAPMRALGNARRVRIVAALHELGEVCVRDAAVIGDTSIALASHHLKALHEAELVERRREGKLTLCRLSVRGTRLVAALLEDSV
jgi:DNA-binding transcriptional ArsR family regulator